MFSFSYLEPVCCSMHSSNCCFLTCLQVSQEAGRVVWYSHHFKNSPEFVVVHTVKAFGMVSRAEADIFWNFPAFLVCTRTDLRRQKPNAYTHFVIHIIKLHVYAPLQTDPPCIPLRPAVADMSHPPQAWSMAWLGKGSGLQGPQPFSPINSLPRREDLGLRTMAALARAA